MQLVVQLTAVAGAEADKRAANAKQSKADSYLPITPASLKSQLEKLKKGFNEKQINYYRNETGKMSNQIGNEIESFMNIADSEISSARQLFEQKRGSLDQETANSISEELRKAEEAIALHNYGSAIQGAKNIISSLNSALKKGDEGDTKLLAIAVLVLGSLVIIVLNYKEAILAKVGAKKEKSIFRRLKKGSEL